MSIREENEALKLANRLLLRALEDSVKLQSHYAELLNMWDGGQRMRFENAQAWLTRLNLIDVKLAERAKTQQKEKA